MEWLATFGYQHEIKATDVVIEAFALLADEHPDLKLAIVGHVSVEFLPVIERMITDLKIADRVVITSHIEAAEYESWLKRTDIAIHLRRATNGEVSAAIGDSLRFGIPTIVTEHRYGGDDARRMRGQGRRRCIASRSCRLDPDPHCRR